MIPHIAVGMGLTGTVRYVMGQGNDHETGERLTLGEGEVSRAEILGGQGFGFEIKSADDIDLARRMMEWSAKPENQASKGIKCTKDCLHASLSWEKGQEPSKAEMVEAAQSFLKALGMGSARAVFVTHDDTPHKHMHIVASRIDPETRKTFSEQYAYALGQAWGLKWERDHGQRSQNENRQKLHKILDAIEARDGAAIVAALTERTPTFTARELDRALFLGMRDKEDRAKFRAEIVAGKNVIGLSEEQGKPITRYTTRDILAAEMALQRNALILADNDRHGIGKARVAATAKAFTLKPEQADALRHLTNGKGLAVLWGEAGTGKSHTLNAVRAAYEAEGVKVLGLAWTHSVVQQMKGDGFTHAATIASELKKIDNGRGQFDRNTVLIVDEAAMLATEHLSKLTAAARQSGAKLILAGDDSQLSSIDKGGMFETLRQTHGAAILKDVQRVKQAEQKTAFGKMHTGEFLGALQTFEKQGGIHWTEKQTHALRDMAKAYTADLAAAPDKCRFMFAYTNLECDALNQYARAIHQRRGDLGADHALATATGAKEFARGDRIQFTGTSRIAKEKNAGLTNGRVGTITGLDIEGGKTRVTVALDTAKNAKPQSVSFVVGKNEGEFEKFKHGYSGTIYRGQGKTLDQSYVCYSANMRRSASYVALTRHRESLHIFAASETVKDLEAMARSMGRVENKRAATAYRIDNDAEVRAELEKTVAALADPRGMKRSPALGAATTATPSASSAGQATASKGRPHEARQAPAHKQRRSAGSVAARSARRTLGGLLDGIFKALLGESSSAPAPKSRRPTLEEYQAQQQQRAKAMQDLGRVAGREVISEADFRMQQETEKKRDRDRGGGQSL
jgi:ATP-dependent exoDNAse (exonuclease V) alpha subunit